MELSAGVQKVGPRRGDERTDRPTHPPVPGQGWGCALSTALGACGEGAGAPGEAARCSGFPGVPSPALAHRAGRASERSPAGAGDKRRGWRCRFDPVYLCPWVCAAPVGWCRGALARGSAAAAVPLLSGAPRPRGSSVRGVALEREHPPQCWGFPALLVPWLCPHSPALPSPSPVLRLLSLLYGEPPSAELSGRRGALEKQLSGSAPSAAPSRWPGLSRWSPLRSVGCPRSGCPGFVSPAIPGLGHGSFQ